MKTYSESTILLLRNPQIIKKKLEKSSQFLLSEQPCEPKILDVPLNTAEVERTRSENVRLQSTLKAILFEFWLKEALVMWESASTVLGDSQINLT